MLCGIAAMVLMILLLDQLLWRPVVVWAQRFRVEEGGAAPLASSWFLDWLRRSRLLRVATSVWQRWRSRRRHRPARPRAGPPATVAPRVWRTRLTLVLFLGLLAGLGYAALQLLFLIWEVPPGQWLSLAGAALVTLARVLASTALGTLWAVPVGLAIGLSPRLSRVLQPVIQVLASFPAPMLFPLVIAALDATGVPLGWGSIVLMLLGTQWYILFNVTAGAMAIPADLQEATQSYAIRGWQRFRVLYFPVLFPYLVTGWVTAAGGAWNASIVAEYVTFRARPKRPGASGPRSVRRPLWERTDSPSWPQAWSSWHCSLSSSTALCGGTATVLGPPASP
jgi:NitT/TauT family transport system permease protein